MWPDTEKTTILLIRHGQTDWNAAGRWQGDVDIPLNEYGRWQAERVAERLHSEHWPISTLYTSDLSRASETAVKIADRLGLKPVHDRRWRERNLGSLEGMTREEIAEKYPELNVPRTFLEPPDGESFVEIKDRAVEAFRDLVQAHAGETVAVISHSGTMRVLISTILEFPDRFYAPFSLRGNTGISRVVLANGGANLNLLNDTAHIEFSSNGHSGK